MSEALPSNLVSRLREWRGVGSDTAYLAAETIENQERRIGELEDLVLKLASGHETTLNPEVRQLLVNVAAILDGWKQCAPQDWTGWDQEQRDAITRHLVGTQETSQVTRPCQCATYCMMAVGAAFDPPVKCRGLRTTRPEHVCGLQGFGRGGPEALNDECPACAQKASVDAIERDARARFNEVHRLPAVDQWELQPEVIKESYRDWVRKQASGQNGRAPQS